MEQISEIQSKRLLKKWRAIKTNICKLRDNNWIKVTKRGCTIITKSHSPQVQEWYLQRIIQAETIINRLTK